MKPLTEFPRDAQLAIKGVLCDIDDTLSTEGKLTAEAYSAMAQLQRAGLLVIPVTGRPAGWCDLIARLWPVDGVVGENGAFYFRYDKGARKMHRHFVDDAATRASHRARLTHIAHEILNAVPGTAMASDQHYRECDLAIDFCEDVAPLPQTAIDEIVMRMEKHGLTAKVSSIHVNGWFGRYDKAARKMRRHFVDDAATRAAHRARLAQIGAEILRAVPGTAIAADQHYRETDLAIDFCEDVAPLPQAAIDEIVMRMEKHGLTAKVSSIHVNGWFGAYDKLSMSKTLMREAFGVDLDTVRANYVFVGDSPNDAPMFGYFPHAVGVANMLDFGTRIERPPAYLSTQRCGAGFAETADCLLAAKLS